MPNYKLTYFNGRGRAELSRLIFAAAGVKYEDVRIEREQWPALKPTTPFGQMPLLDVDGVTLCQSYTVARFLARKFKLAGRCDLEQAKTDMINDCIDDTMKPAMQAFGEKDEARKGEIMKKYLDEQLPNYLTMLEALLKKNKNGDSFFVGDSLTWADLNLLILHGLLKMVGAEALFVQHTKLDGLRQRVEKVPKVADWLAKRPASDF